VKPPLPAGTLVGEIALITGAELSELPEDFIEPPQPVSAVQAGSSAAASTADRSEESIARRSILTPVCWT